MPDVRTQQAESVCLDCGWPLSDCQCFGDDIEDDDAACSHCSGEGTCENGCDPGWYDDIHPCHACSGTGRAKDQVIW